MTPQTVLIELRLRLNKSHSSDYDNIPDWVAVKAVQKAQLEVMRSLIKGVNISREGDEQTRVRVDDLQQFLKTKKISGFNKKTFFESEDLPNDYLWFKNIIPKASKDTCKNQPLYSQLVEEANVPRYLSDWSMKPTFEWRTTFHTLISDKVRIYRDQFLIENVEMTYYRKPAEFNINGIKDENGVDSSNIDLEFKDDLAHVILDRAAAIIAGDIELANQYNTAEKRADKHE